MAVYVSMGSEIETRATVAMAAGSMAATCWVPKVAGLG